MTVLIVLAIFGLAFTIKETPGPWNLMDRLRNLLMRIPFLGVQFFKLLDCYFCLGFHCGWIIYLLSEEHPTWQFFILWGLAGGAICLILDGLLERLHRE
jgi:hypothetical protein